MFLALAAALPTLFWDAPPDTAPALREAGITSIQVPAARAGEWKNVEGISLSPGDPSSAVKLLAPSVQYRPNEASATRTPWLVSNGWKFLRNPDGRFWYDVPGVKAALAAAEAFCFG